MKPETNTVAAINTPEQLMGRKIYCPQLQRFLTIVVGREAHIMASGKENTHIHMGREGGRERKRDRQRGVDGRRERI